MRTHRRTVALAVSAILSFACSDASTGPPPEPGASESTLPALFVSEAIVEGASSVSASLVGGVAGLTYVSLPPGTLPEAVSVVIRNLTNGAEVGSAWIIAGGFDPIAIGADAGDRLELSFADRTGAIRVEIATVPVRRPPAIVRTSPTKGRTDVPLNAVPRIVFTEPMDPGTLSGNIELRRGGSLVSDRFDLVTGEPWSAELASGVSLDAGATYELTIAQDVRDLDGDSIEAPVTVTFTTVASAGGAASPAGGSQASVNENWRLAFVSTRDGQPYIYVVNGDGSGLRRLAYGAGPAWSPDGRSIAYHTWRSVPGSDGYEHGLDADEIRIMDANGSNDRLLVEDVVGSPAWSPDGQWIAFHRDGQIYRVAVDGSSETRLVGPETGWFALYFPAWSPDGQRIAFEYIPFDWMLVIANADGSYPRLFEPIDQQWRGMHFGYPAWSPDGSRLAFSTGHGFAGVLSATPWGGDIRVHAYGYQPDWSPDGASLVYQRGHAIGCAIWQCPQRIFVSDFAGATRQLVPEAVAPGDPLYSDFDAAWAPARIVP